MPRIVVFDELATPQRVTRVTGLSENEGPWNASGRTDFVISPDLSALEGIVARKYWKHEGGAIVTYTAGEIAAQDAAEAAAEDLDGRESAKEGLLGFGGLAQTLRAFADIVKDELNILRTSQYGGLYGATGTGQVISAGATEVLADMAGSSSMPTVGNITSDNTTGVVTLGDAGNYLVDFGMSFSATASEWELSIYGNNVQTPQSIIRRDVSGTGLVGDVSRQFIANTPVPNIDLTIRVAHTEGSSQTMTPQHWTLTVTKLNDYAPRTLTQLRNAINARIDDGSVDS